MRERERENENKEEVFIRHWLLTIAKKYDQLCIEEKGSGKSATFTPSRWASFLLCLDEIHSQLEKFATGENVAYRCHYGGGWCVSVTSGFACVDLRQLYEPFGKLEWKPTRYTCCCYVDMMCFLLLVYILFFSCCVSYLINEYAMLGLVLHYVCRNGRRSERSSSTTCDATIQSSPTSHHAS